MPSPEGVRNVKLDAIPADLVDMVEINKTLSANQDADVIGGSVNLVTKSPTDKPYVTILGMGGYTPISNGRTQYQFAGTAGQRFGPGKKFLGNTGLIGTLSIPGNGQKSLFVNQISGIQTLLTPFRGMLELTSFAPITIVGIRARYNERNDFLISTTPPGDEGVPPPASGLYFPQFADAGGYSTQFVLFSAQPGQRPSGTLQLVPQASGAVNLVLSH